MKRADVVACVAGTPHHRARDYALLLLGTASTRDVRRVSAALCRAVEYGELAYHDRGPQRCYRPAGMRVGMAITDQTARDYQRLALLRRRVDASVTEIFEIKKRLGITTIDTEVPA